nr:hypothetical protein [Pedobacter sp. AJM]
MISAALEAITIIGPFPLPDTIVGSMEQSMILIPSKPLRRSFPSTGSSSLVPILQVEIAWYPQKPLSMTRLIRSSGETIRERYHNASDEMTPIYLEFAKSNPKSYVSLMSLTQLADDSDQLTQIDAIYPTLSAELKATKAGKNLLKTLEAAKKTAVGVMAMDFTQNDLDGKPVKLSDFKGKYVLVDFGLPGADHVAMKIQMLLQLTTNLKIKALLF